MENEMIQNDNFMSFLAGLIFLKIQHHKEILHTTGHISSVNNNHDLNFGIDFLKLLAIIYGMFLEITNTHELLVDFY